MEEQALKEKTGRVIAQLPIQVASFLLNEKRDSIQEIENRHRVQLIIVPNPNMDTPHFEVQRYRKDDKDHLNKVSYELATEIESELSITEPTKVIMETPAVKTITPPMPAPPPATKQETSDQGPGFLIRIWNGLFASGLKESDQSAKEGNTAPTTPPSSSGRSEKNTRTRAKRGNRFRTKPKPRTASQSTLNSKEQDERRGRKGRPSSRRRRKPQEFASKPDAASDKELASKAKETSTFEPQIKEDTERSENAEKVIN